MTTPEVSDHNAKQSEPIFRWAGSKRKMLPLLASYWPSNAARYVEPFAGSAALFFRLAPARALLGDINGGLIEAYEVIRERPEDVHEAVCALRRGRASYYKIRGERASRGSRFSRAIRFVYLNRFCFNGIFRTNLDGEFNVPYAGEGVIPPVSSFKRCATLLEKASLKCGDFGQILSRVRPADFVYLDPPYAVGSRRVFREYDKRAFTKKDLERLGDHLQAMDGKGARFLLSYADCAEARLVFRAWTVRRVRVRRHIAGFASARRSSFELLVTNIKPDSDTWQTQPANSSRSLSPKSAPTRKTRG